MKLFSALSLLALGLATQLAFAVGNDLQFYTLEGTKAEIEKALKLQPEERTKLPYHMIQHSDVSKAPNMKNIWVKDHARMLHYSEYIKSFNSKGL